MTRQVSWNAIIANHLECFTVTALKVLKFASQFQSEALPSQWQLDADNGSLIPRRI